MWFLITYLRVAYISVLQCTLGPTISLNNLIFLSLWHCYVCTMSWQMLNTVTSTLIFGACVSVYLSIAILSLSIISEYLEQAGLASTCNYKQHLFPLLVRSQTVSSLSARAVRVNFKRLRFKLIIGMHVSTSVGMRRCTWSHIDGHRESSVWYYRSTVYRYIYLF